MVMLEMANEGLHYYELTEIVQDLILLRMCAKVANKITLTSSPFSRCQSYKTINYRQLFCR